MSRPRALLARLAVAGAALYALDRLAKVWALARLLRAPAPPTPARWPAVTMLHPITRVTAGRSGLAANLRARARLDYPGPIRHLLLCDAADADSLATCRAFLAAHPALDATLVAVPAPVGAAVAPKLVKLAAGLARVGAVPVPDAVLCLIDDDIAPRPAALRGLVAALGDAGGPVGAAFGLPCYTNWRNPWSALLSAFNNANFPHGAAALAAFAAPPRITGHLVAYRRATLAAAGGLAGLDDQIDDDFALARRLRAAGAEGRQAAVVYDVDNDLADRAALARQLRRWFVLPRRAMAGALTPREVASGGLVSVGLLLPSIVAALAVAARARGAWGALAACLACHGAAALASEGPLLRSPAAMPARRWPLLPVVALALPAVATAALLRDGGEVEWRGQRLRIAPGGQFEVLP